MLLFVDGYPGKYIIMARRSGDKWYVTGVNAQKETIKTKISLPMFAVGSEVSVYADDDKLNGSLSSVKINKKQELQIIIPQHGGVVITNTK